MSDSNITGIINAIVGELRQIAKSESVIGTPVSIGDRTVVPITKLSVGFGAGGGEGSKPNAGSGFGGGGGGGAMIEPVAFLVMDKDKVHLLSIRKPGALDAILEAAPDLIDKLKDWSKKKEGGPTSGIAPAQ